MEEIMSKLVAHTGIDKATAEKVIAFLKDHSSDVVKALESHAIKDRLPAGLGKLF
jgi:hypothetical protein